MRTWLKWILFANAYTPFFLILLIRDFKAGAWPLKDAGAVWQVFGTPWLSWLLIAVILLSNLALILFLKGFFLAYEPLPQFKNATSKAGDSLNYIVTYIIPFLEFDTTKDFLPLLILLTVIGVIYVHSNLLATNPMLSLCGYRVYELSKESNESFLLIARKSRNEIKPGIPVIQVTDDIYLEVRRGRSR